MRLGLLTRIKFLPLLLFCGGLAQAQFFTTTKTTSLSASTEVITLQQPTTAGTIRGAKFVAAYVASTTALTLTLERSGTVASTTALTTNPVNINEGTAQTLAFSSSNVGTGTTIGNYQVAANGSLIIDLSKVYFPNVNKSQNLTLRTSSGTGTVSIVILWQELAF